MRNLYAAIFVLLACCLTAQTRNPLPRFSVRANVGIPKIVSSKALRTSFLGLYELNGSANLKLFDNFFVGVGYQNALLKSQTYFQQKNIYTKMRINNGFVRVGYDAFYGDHSFATIALNAGYNNTHFTGVVAKPDSTGRLNPSRFTSGYIEPEVGCYFLVEDNFAIGAHVSYNMNFKRFDPSMPYFNKVLDYSNLRNTANISWISIGFGFYYGFVRKK